MLKNAFTLENAKIVKFIANQSDHYIYLGPLLQTWINFNPSMDQ